MTKDMNGVVSFLLTPTTADGSIDGERLCRLADEQIAAGIDGLTLFGSTGAIGSFTEDERRGAAEVLVRHVAGRVPVMIGTGAMTTAEAVRLSRHAEQAGADAVLVVPITYWLLTDEELLAHYRAIAGAIGLPLMLYNNPRLSGVDLQPHVVAQLVETPNIGAIKEAAPDLMRVSILAQMLPGRLRIFAGRDAAAFEMLMLGAEGWTSGLANITPRHCVELFRLVRGGEIDAARALWHRLSPIATFTRDKGLVRACHTACEIMGRPAGRPRPPIGVLSSEDARRLEALMTALGDVVPAPRKVAAE
ncbi:dihydrodipicolinate synthase family protein [Vineibacter terrae]|uniref:Dihydrodipicolinate synthase family protein n=1 Tax=Vineibacter terrae TaxID=2586908 RepID=A0A5C8PS15_9HYPH|nr:dihydrodipicolinate synthase family protein [Vineibacter terrae]TXL78783.1 dihydrodipicolinate synthase family protein [Vineibacter terrae]